MKQIIILLLILFGVLIAPKVLSAPTASLNYDYLEKADKLEIFFTKHNCPQLNFDLITDYLDAAERYKIDWRLLPAISIQESSCFKHYPPATNNGFGWASARVGFKSIPDSIDFVSRQLAEGQYYIGKTLKQKLNCYNPDPEYAPKIINLMNQIENYQRQ